MSAQTWLTTFKCMDIFHFFLLVWAFYFQFKQLNFHKVKPHFTERLKAKWEDKEEENVRVNYINATMKSKINKLKVRIT